MIAKRRKIFSRLIGAGAITFLGAGRSLAVQYQAVIPCSHCGTGFRVEWNGTETGHTAYQCPKCSKMSRVYWDSKGVQKVEKA
jgi:DNA-directed RNA polymerase subunit RPC12/RpoP